jgi:ATP-dependent Clp protease adaptor protein ClpS
MPTVDTPETETRETTGVAAPWNVIVHNDPVNLMSYVTLIFRKVLGFSKDKAQKHMLEVHQKGRSTVWTGGREKAEFYVQQLHSHLLLATLEPAPQD